MTMVLGEATRQLLGSSRPVSWVNTAYPFAAAYLLSGGGITAELVIGTLFFLIPYNLLMYGINDVFDYESDLRNPRKGGIEGIVLSDRWHGVTLWASGLLALKEKLGPVLWQLPERFTRDMERLALRRTPPPRHSTSGEWVRTSEVGAVGRPRGGPGRDGGGGRSAGRASGVRRRRRQIELSARLRLHVRRRRDDQQLLHHDDRCCRRPRR